MVSGEASPSTRPRARDGDASGVYVYGIVRRWPHGSVEAGGVAAAAPIRMVAGEGACAVVSDVPAIWRDAGRSDVQAHDRVLHALMAHETVIPMRFGVVMASDAEVSERLLERHVDEFSSLFELLHARVQMSVKAYYLEEALLREVLRRRPELKKRSDAVASLPVERSQQERIALGRDVAAAVEEQRELDQRLLLGQLAEAAEDVRIEPPVGDRHVMNLQLLVDSSRRAELDAIVQRLSEEYGDRFAFRYVGPLPPYSFTDLVLSEE
jgi:hypothetical protein